MNIAIDFDDTWTADPVLFQDIACKARLRGHTVYIVTMRGANQLDEVRQHCAAYVHHIVGTDRQPKRRFCESIGIKIHVWMDDTPDFILQGSLPILDPSPIPHSAFRTPHSQ
jgi:hypothetical protein